MNVWRHHRQRVPPREVLKINNNNSVLKKKKDLLCTLRFFNYTAGSVRMDMSQLNNMQKRNIFFFI